MSGELQQRVSTLISRNPSTSKPSRASFKKSRTTRSRIIVKFCWEVVGAALRGRPFRGQFNGRGGHGVPPLQLYQLDRNTGGGALFRVTDGVLHVPHAIDHVIDSRVRVTTDVYERLEFSNLTIERGADGDAAEPIDPQILFRRQEIRAGQEV